MLSWDRKKDRRFVCLFVMVKVFQAGNRRNEEYIPLHTLKKTLFIMYVWSIYAMCFKMCVLAGREERVLLYFTISTTIFQIITQRDANQSFTHCWHVHCYELMFMSWWLSHGWRRKREMAAVFLLMSRDQNVDNFLPLLKTALLPSAGPEVGLPNRKESALFISFPCTGHCATCHVGGI